MPGLDRTGPMGQGPMTGGSRGRLAGEAVATPSQVGFGGGAGYGRGSGAGCGRGGGHGRRNQFYATGLTGWERAAQAQAAQPQAAAAQPQADSLVRIESALADVLERLERLEGAGQT